MIPLAVEEVGEASGADVDELVEDRRDYRLIMDLKVHARVTTQTQQLLQNEPGGSLEYGINDGEYQLSVSLAFMLIQQDSVLYVEVRLVVLEVHVLGQEESADDIFVDFAHE